MDPIAHYARQYGTASADNDRSIVRSHYPRLVRHFYVKSILANLDLEKTAFVLTFSEVWPGVENLDLYTKMELPKGSKRRVKERLKPYVKDAQACDLIDKLLWLDPSKRINSDDALNHDFFWTDPMPCKCIKCPKSKESYFMGEKLKICFFVKSFKLCMILN